MRVRPRLRRGSKAGFSVARHLITSRRKTPAGTFQTGSPFPQKYAVMLLYHSDQHQQTHYQATHAACTTPLNALYSRLSELCKQKGDLVQSFWNTRCLIVITILAKNIQSQDGAPRVTAPLGQKQEGSEGAGEASHASIVTSFALTNFKVQQRQGIPGR